MIDLRSDTVTKPTQAMMASMMSASVGDDVWGEDPTVNELERRVADYFGKEAGLFVPSGTMSNQIAIRVHCRPQDEVLLESTSHIYLWEAGGPAVLSGVTLRMVDGKNGVLELADLENKLHPDDIHSVRSRLICLENTHNRGGGTILPIAGVELIAAWARDYGLAMHLDGARIWNAIAATGIGGREWAKHFDTLSVCFSKGLGAPVGSALVGPKDFITHARRIRKLFGGGMRQAGFLTAACIHAMDHHIDRLSEDHDNAKVLAAAISAIPGFKLVPEKVETNLVWVEVDPTRGTAKSIAGRLKDQGILVAALGKQMLRMVTHLGVSKKECEKAADALSSLEE